MTLDEAKAYLRDHCPLPYIEDAVDPQKITLDGDFSIEDLRAIIVIMEQEQQ